MGKLQPDEVLKDKIAYSNLSVDKGYWHTVLHRLTRRIVKKVTQPSVYIHDRYSINSHRNADFALRKYDGMAGRYREKILQRNSDDAEEFLLIENDNLSPRLIKQGEYYAKLWDFIAKTIETYTPLSVLEVGAGEFTTLANVMKIIRKRENGIQASGLDISWSRVAYGRKYAGEVNEEIEDFVVGDMLSLPFPDKSYDVVFTFAVIEQAPHDAGRALNELYRVARKAVILIEPSYEFGSDKQKKRHRRLDYIVGLPIAIEKARLHLAKHEPVPFSLYNYRLGLYILEKKADSRSQPCSKGFICPGCKQSLDGFPSAWFCKSCGKAYPVLEGIACLDERYAIVASKMGELIG